MLDAARCCAVVLRGKYKSSCVVVACVRRFNAAVELLRRALECICASSFALIGRPFTNDGGGSGGPNISPSPACSSSVSYTVGSTNEGVCVGVLEECLRGDDRVCEVWVGVVVAVAPAAPAPAGIGEDDADFFWGDTMGDFLVLGGTYLPWVVAAVGLNNLLRTSGMTFFDPANSGGPSCTGGGGTYLPSSAALVG